MSYTSDLDNEEHPRNAAAIRTAILLGAEFEQDEWGYWEVKGIRHKSKEKTMPAWLFLSTMGVGIDGDGVPRRFNDIKPDATSHDAWRRVGLCMGDSNAND